MLQRGDFIFHIKMEWQHSKGLLMALFFSFCLSRSEDAVSLLGGTLMSFEVTPGGLFHGTRQNVFMPIRQEATMGTFFDEYSNTDSCLLQTVIYQKMFPDAHRCLLVLRIPPILLATKAAADLRIRMQITNSAISGKHASWQQSVLMVFIPKGCYSC